MGKGHCVTLENIRSQSPKGKIQAYIYSLQKEIEKALRPHVLMGGVSNDELLAHT